MQNKKQIWCKNLSKNCRLLKWVTPSATVENIGQLSIVLQANYLNPTLTIFIHSFAKLGRTIVQLHKINSS